MKSKTVKLIFTALALCFMICILAMGAFAAEDGSSSPTDTISGGTSTPTPATVSVTVSIEGLAYVDSVSVTINGEAHTGYEIHDGRFTVDVTEGSNVSITVTPKEGYKVSVPTTSGWTTSEGAASITSIQSGATINFEIEAKDYHDISATISPDTMENKASISVYPTRAYQGQTITVTVRLDGGYKVDQISAGYANESIRITETSDSTSTVKYYTFTMPDDDVSVNATITKAVYSVKKINPTYGNISITAYNNKDLDNLSYGDLVYITVTPDQGYYLKALKLNGEAVSVSSSNYSYSYSHSFYVKENVVVTAEFTNELTVTTEVNNYWYGSASVYKSYWGSDIFEPGDRVYVECKPKDGYNVKKVTATDTVTGDTLSVSQSTTDKNIYYFTMPSHPVNVYVEFQEGYAIKIADTKYGKVTASAENADEDDIIYITVKPNDGYALTRLKIETDGGDTVLAEKSSFGTYYYFYMPDDNVTVTATFGIAHKEMPFTDVYTYSWFHDAVQFVYDNDIMNGVSDTSFNPDGTVTRGMRVTLLWRLAGEPSSFGGGFSDVPAGHSCYSAAAWAARNGIVNGMTSTTFEPDSNITREQLVTILYRYAQYLGYSTTGSSLYGFTDASSVSSYATNAMSWAVKHGIISGVTTSTLVPAGTATRAQAAQMFMSFSDFLG